MGVVDLVNYAYWLECQLIGRERELKDTKDLLAAVTAEARDDTEALHDRVELLERHRSLKRQRE
jgi:hypothetical protein